MHHVAGVHLLSQLLAPSGKSRGVQLAQCAAQLLRNCSCIALEHHSRLVSIPLAWLHIHQDKLDAGRPLGWLAKVQLPVQPAYSHTHIGNNSPTLTRPDVKSYEDHTGVKQCSCTTLRMYWVS